MCAFFLVIYPAKTLALNVTISPNSLYSASCSAANITITGIPVAQTCSLNLSVDGSPPVLFLCGPGPAPCIIPPSVVNLVCNQPPGGHSINLSSVAACANPPDPTNTFYTILPPCPLLNFTSPATLAGGNIGQAYSSQMQTAGGSGPVTFTLAAGTLPPGLTLSTTGLISGTPAASGSYTFTVNATDQCPSGAQTVQKTFTIVIDCPLLNIVSSASLPSAAGGQPYSFQLQTAGGQAPVSYNLVSGGLPPGLSLSSFGFISGTPTNTGNYSFTVQATDSCFGGAQVVSKTFSLDVNIAVNVSVVPAAFSIPRNTAFSNTLSYFFTSSAPLAITLTSPQGTFLAGSTVIGEVNTPLTANMTGGMGRAVETIAIPVAISRRAEELGTSQIQYVRTFTGPMVSVTAVSNITVTTEAGAELRITRLELYFQNGRPEITVKRNEQSLQAYADIRYTGSGLFQGFWEVDGRILAHVKRHLVYGRSITLESPAIPPLPTFVSGTHRVRFVVTNPDGDIPFPEALYFVTENGSGVALHRLELMAPEDAAEIAYAPFLFTWESSDVAVIYLIEFVEEGNEKPFFSSYRRSNNYELPSHVLHELFAPDKAYQWRVIGYDLGNNIVSKSFYRTFVFQ